MSGQYITLSCGGPLKAVLWAVRPFSGNGSCISLSPSCSGFDMDNTFLNAEAIDELTRAAGVVSKVEERKRMMSGVILRRIWKRSEPEKTSRKYLKTISSVLESLSHQSRNQAQHVDNEQ